LLDYRARFFQAEAIDLAATMGPDSSLEFGPKLFSTYDFAGLVETLQQLKSQIGALRMRKRKGRLEKLILRHAHP
jgi:hypothetical protein